MTWTSVQKSPEATGNGAITPTLGVAATASNLLVVEIIQGGGVSWTLPANWQKVTGVSNSGISHPEIWCLLPPNNPGGATGVLCTPSSGTPNAKAYVQEFHTDVAGATVTINAVGTAVGGTVSQLSVASGTNAAAGDLALCCFHEHFTTAAAITWTDPAGFTLGQADTASGGNHLYGGFNLSVAAGPLTVLGKSNTASDNAHGWAGAIATFTASPPAAGHQGLVGAYVPTAPFPAGTTQAQAINLWQTDSARSLTVRRVYFTTEQIPAAITTDLQADVAAGRKVCISMRPAFNPPTNADLAALDTFLSSCKTAGLNAEISLWQEPYNSGLPGHVSDGLTVALFISGWQFYATTIRQYFPMTFDTSVYSVNHHNENAYYPGDAWVDNIATDFYCSEYNGGERLDLAASIADAASPKKPFGLWECTSSTDPANGQTQAQATTYFGYNKTFFTGRLTAGKSNADIMIFNSNSNRTQETAITVPDGATDPISGLPEYRNALFDQWFDALNAASGTTILNITTTSLPAGTQGTLYPSQTLAAVGGTPAYTWSIITGALPAGLALSSGGVLSGTPTVSGTFNFTVQVADTASHTDTQAYSLVIAPTAALSVTTTSIPAAEVGSAYTFTLTAAGGTTPYTWLVLSGALPPGLALSSAGVLSGTPTAAGSPSITFQVTDATSATAVAVLTVTVAATIAISTPSPLPGGTTGTSYSQLVTASDGTGTLTWSITSGTLPAGLTLDTATGLISGTPTGTGTSVFTVQAADAYTTASKSLSITITAPAPPPVSASFVTYSVVTKVPAVDVTGLAEPDNISIPVQVTPAAGNWLYCMIAWRQTANLPTVTWSVSDDAHNWWDLLGAPLVTSDAQNTVRTTIWRCPAARIWPQPNGGVTGMPPGLRIMAAPTGIYSSAAVCVVEFTGMQAGVSDLHAQSGFVRHFTTVNLSTPAPAGGAEAVVLAVGAADSHTAALAARGGGWQATTASAASATDTGADLAALFAWQVATAEVDLNLTSHLSGGVAASICGSLSQLPPPAQPQPSWPFFLLEAAPGAGQGTPPDALGWVPLPTRWLDLKSYRQGREFELSSLSTGTGALTLDNPNGELIPPAAQIISGTPVRLRACWQGGQWQAQFHGNGSVGSPQLNRDWSWTAAGTPLDSTYFIVTTSQSAAITVGDVFTDTNNPGTVFTVSAIGLPAFGFVNVHFTPSASAVMSSPDVVSFASIPVTPGQQVTFAAWLACSAPYAKGVVIDLRFKTPGGTIVGDILSVPVTTTAPQLVAASGQAPPGATRVTVLILASGTPPAGTVFSAAGTTTDTGYAALPPGYTGWVPQNSAAITATRPWGYDRNGPPNVTPWYIPMAAFFEKVPVTWDANFRGVVPATISDVWFGMQENMRSVLLAELLNDNPYALWPCTDPAGSGQIGASNAAPPNGLPLAVSTPAVAGAGAFTSTFGANSSAILGAGSTLLLNSLFRIGSASGMWQLTLPPSGVGLFQSLACTDSNFPPIAGGVTVATWFQCQSGGPLPITSTVVMSVQNASGRGFNVYLDLPVAGGGTGKLFLDSTGTLSTPTGTQATGLGPTVFNTATNPPLGHVAVTFNRTSYTAYVNGVQVAAGNWAMPLPPSFQYVSFNGAAGTPTGSAGVFGFAAGTSYIAIVGNFSGSVGFAGVWPQILTPTRILTHYQAGATAMTGESPSNRIERLIQNSSNSGLRRHIQPDTGTWLAPAVSMQDTVSGALSNALTHLTQSLLPGVLSIAPTGEVFYLARQNAYNQAPRWLLGENIAAGEQPVQPMPLYGSDPTKTVNQIQLTELDTQTTTVPQVQAIEQASQGQVGTITYFETGYLKNDAQSPLNAGPGLLDLANWLACTFAVPRQRVEQLSVDAAQHPAAWPLVLGAAVGDIAISNRRFSVGGTGPPQLSVTGRISQTTRTFTFGYARQVAGRLDIFLDPAPENSVLTTGDPVRGLLNGQNVMAW